MKKFSDDDQQAELDELRKRLEQLTAEFAENEKSWRRAQQIELHLLEAEDLASLFRLMVAGLAKSFHLAQVTLILCDPDHEVRHLLIAGGNQPEEFPGLMFVDSLSGIAPQYVALRSPWLGAYTAADHQLLFPGNIALKSVAVIPLQRQDRLMGSLNFGSDDPHRYTENHATDILAHIGKIASFALENSVNRARLFRAGSIDVLTGWHNRRYLQARLKEEVGRSRRERCMVSCLMIDLDKFKHVNDEHGHLAGDAVLREVAQRIESEIRVNDVAARYGGEEFVVLLPATNLKGAKVIAERIRAAVCEDSIDLGHGVTETITVSIGVSGVIPDIEVNDLKTVGDALLAHADVALYAAKSAGRNQVAFDLAD